MSFESENTRWRNSKVDKNMNVNIASSSGGAPGAVDCQVIDGTDHLETETDMGSGGSRFLADGGWGLSSQIRDYDPVMENFKKLSTTSGGGYVKLANPNQEFEIFETAEVVETVLPCERKLRAGNCSHQNQTECDLNPSAESFVPLLENLDLSENSSCVSENVSLLDEMEDPIAVLKALKGKNSDRPVFAHLNINSLSSKFEPLTEMVRQTIDFLLVTESKLDDTFPIGQFQMEGFSRPIRLDRTRNGGGLIIFTRNDLTCHELKPRLLYPELECTFLEVRIRHNKWLVLVGYNPQKENIGLFLDKVSMELDKLLPKYDNLLMLGDWNSAVTEEDMADFCDMYDLENLIKEPTCFKSTENPSSIDVILTNKKHSFQHTSTVETGLSDFHLMTVTVMKCDFKKKEPIRIVYHDKSKFDAIKFREKIRNQIASKGKMSLEELQSLLSSNFLEDAPLKEKVLRGNNAPFMNKTLSQAYSTRARLKNKKQKYPTQRNEDLYRKQRNYCVSLTRKEKKKHFNNINLSLIKDKKKFYDIVKPKFTGKSKVKEHITLIEKDEVISDETKVAEILNNNFVDAVPNLGIEKSVYVEEIASTGVKSMEQKN